MKKILMTILAVAAVLTGCNKHVIEEPGDKGSFSLELSYEGEYATKAEVPQVNIDEFIVVLERQSDGMKNSFTYAELKTQIENNGGVELTPGHYSITATSPRTEPAAFEQPIFKGSSEFDVHVGKVTSVSLVCTLQNMMVSLVATDGFNNELSEYDVIVTNGHGSLTWTKDDVVADKPGFFTVAPLHVKVSAKRTIDPDGESLIFEGDIKNVAPKDHHIITLKAVATGAVGGIEIDIDYTTNKIYSEFEVPGFDEEGVPGGDEGAGGDDDGDGPVVDESAVRLIWATNPEYKPLEVQGEEEMAGKVELQLEADNGVKEFAVKIVSDDAEFVGLVSNMVSPSYVEKDAGGAVKSVTIDMVNDLSTDPDTGAEVGGAVTFSTILSMPYGNSLVGMKSVPLSMSRLVPLIKTAAAPGTNHYFTLIVSDSAGEEKSWTLTFFLP